MEQITEFYQENPQTVDYVVGCLVSFVLWAVYLEVNPQIGGVYWRQDHTGSKRFKLKGLWPMIMYPFQTTHFWRPENWDLNWIMWTQAGAGAFMFLKNIDSIRDHFFQAVEVWKMK